MLTLRFIEKHVPLGNIYISIIMKKIEFIKDKSLEVWILKILYKKYLIKMVLESNFHITLPKL
jgi:hypothetical protein